jgi:fused signal recognition particle receptor
MFGFLKKKLKEGIDKISKKVKQKEEEKIEEVVEEVKKEEKIEEPKEELVEEVEEEIDETPSDIEAKEETLPDMEEIEERMEDIKEEIEELGHEVEKEEAKVPEEKIKLIEKPKVEEVKPEVKVIEKKVEPKKELKPEEPKEEVKPKKEVKPKVKIAEEKIETKKETKKKIGILHRIKRKVTEKKLEENDVKDILDDLKTSLLESDVALDVAEKISEDLKSNLVGKFIKRKDVEKVIKESFRKSILEILDVESFDLLKKIKTKKPFLIIFVGFNGAGKTTSIARIGYMLKQKGFSCVFAAADSWRAAAIEQIEEHGRNLDIEVIKHKYGADPAAVIFDAVKHAEAKNIDVILADTAGRSHANVNLVDELKKIIRVNKPDLKVLVLDALTGNDIYDQCKTFNDAVGIDAMILTKTDVYEKGGAALSASHTVNKPIIYFGVGQNYEDLEKFDANRIVDKLLD